MSRSTRLNARVGSGDLSRSYAPIGATNFGINLTLKTDATRLAYIPQLGETVYATDAKKFYIGDGTTVGGVADDLGFSTRQLIDQGFIKPRHVTWMPLAQAAIASKSLNKTPKLLSIGDSITRGDGSTGGGVNGWPSQLGALLDAWAGTADSRWNPVVNAVSGSMSGTALAFIGEYMDPAAWLNPTRPRKWALSVSPTQMLPSLVTYSMGRNESLYVPSADDYALHTRIALRQIRRHNADAVFVTEQPMINGTTGALLDTESNWNPLYRAGLRTAADEGASVVDVWGFFMMLRSFGIDMRDFITTDGIHPNDAGHKLYAALVFRCITAPTEGTGARFRDQDMTDGRSHIYCNYRAESPATPTTIGTGGLTSALTQGTSRALHLNESSLATSTVYVIPTSGTLSFRTPGGVRGLFVSYLTDANSTGRPSVRMNGQVPNSPVTTGVRWDGFKADGTTPLTFPGTGRQFDYYYSTLGQPGLLVDGRPGTLTITANGGQVTVLGVSFVTAGTQIHSVWADRTTSGTVSSSTFADGEASRTITGGIGESETLKFYGTSLTVEFESGPSAGQVSWGVDGGALGSFFELWSTVGNIARKPQRLAYDLPVGWHTVTIQVTGKNASSTAYDVKYGHVSVERGTPDPSVEYVPLEQGEVYSLVESWKYAQIHRVISGSPTVEFTANASTITLGGTGAAVVRLTRS